MKKQRKGWNFSKKLALVCTLITVGGVGSWALWRERPLALQANEQNVDNELNYSASLSSDNINIGNEFELIMNDNMTAAISSDPLQLSTGIGASPSIKEMAYLLIDLPAGVELFGEKVAESNNGNPAFTLSKLDEEGRKLRLDWKSEAQAAEIAKLPLRAVESGKKLISVQKNDGDKFLTAVSVEALVSEGIEAQSDEQSEVATMDSVGTQATGTAVTSATDLVSKMSYGGDEDLYLTQDLYNVGSMTITANRRLDLNGHTLSFANNAKIKLDGGASFTEFKLFSSKTKPADDPDDPNGIVLGKIIGNITTTENSHRALIHDGSSGSRGATNASPDGKNINATVIFQNVDMNAQEICHLTWTKEVVFKGENKLYSTFRGITATNIRFYGDPDNPNNPENANVNSTTTTAAGSSPGSSSESLGPVNFCLGHFYGSSTSEKRGNDARKFLVEKNAKVNAINYGEGTGNYRNCVTMYNHIVVNGTFNGYTHGTGAVFRTTSSSGNDTIFATITYNPGSVSRISAENSNASYGVIYSFKMNLLINNPEIFDIRYKGRTTSSAIRPFAGSYGGQTNSKAEAINTDHALWFKTSNLNGQGNPAEIYQGVPYLLNSNIVENQRGTVSIPGFPAFQSSFDLREISRWSNDIYLPAVRPVDGDGNFIQKGSDGYYVYDNDWPIAGETDYTDPAGNFIGKIAPGSTIARSGTVGPATTYSGTDGKWSFGATGYPGGKTGTLKVTDTDTRYSTINIRTRDVIPPTGVGKAFVTTVGNTGGGLPTATTPRVGLASYSDETTLNNNNIGVAWVTSDGTPTTPNMSDVVATVGRKVLYVQLTDEAGNDSDPIEVVIYVKSASAVDTHDGIVDGQNFEMDLDDWTAADADGKRTFVIDEGKAVGFEKIYSGTTLIDTKDVTNDPTKFLIDYSGVVSPEEGKTYPIKLKVGTTAPAEKTIYVTFIQKQAFLKVRFVDEDDHDIAGVSEISIESKINMTVDLTAEDDVQDAISAILSKHYDLIKKPGTNQNEQILITANPTEVKYEFAGKLIISSGPQLMDFGVKEVVTNPIRVEEADLNSEKLIVTDTRSTKDNWEMRAKLTKEFTLVGDPNTKITNILKYNNGGSTELDFALNQPVVIAQHKNTSTDYIVSDTWLENGPGFKMDIANGKVNKLGQYQAKILFELSDVPGNGG